MRLPEEKIVDEEKIAKIVKKLKEEGRKVVFTNGCYDIIHAGHIKTFFEAKKGGDILIVGINSDESVRRLKGANRPILSLEMRAFVVAGCEAVDFVVPFSEDTPEKLINIVEPDVLVKGEDWEEDKIVGAELVKKKGGKVVRVKLIPGISTTEIIRKIKENKT